MGFWPNSEWNKTTIKRIETLVDDVNELLLNGTESTQEEINTFAQALATALAPRLIREKREPTLRMSNIGKPCERQLWYDINRAEESETFRPETYLKFLYGDILEELLLFLAEKAGHRVEGRQDKLSIAGIVGHRDAIIDGVTIDVKSASSYSFTKFSNGLTPEGDGFGYLGQLKSYVLAGKDDPLVTDKRRGGFFVIDKTLGHICLDLHNFESDPLEPMYEYKKEMVAKDTPPERGFEPIPDGKSGNMKLGINCSYCSFKELCHPGLRTFLYSNKPIFLTTVERTPQVHELIKGTSKSVGE